MAEIESKGGMAARRIMEQPADAISLYSDYTQILSTGNEVLLQFYETIPKPPDLQGEIAEVVTRLRATIVLSPSHGLNIAQLLLKQLVASTPDSGK